MQYFSVCKHSLTPNALGCDFIVDMSKYTWGSQKSALWPQVGTVEFSWYLAWRYGCVTYPVKLLYLSTLAHNDQWTMSALYSLLRVLKIQCYRFCLNKQILEARSEVTTDRVHMHFNHLCLTCWMNLELPPYRDGRMSWASVSRFSILSNLSPLVRTLVESNQWLKNVSLFLPRQAH